MDSAIRLEALDPTPPGALSDSAEKPAADMSQPPQTAPIGSPRRTSSGSFPASMGAQQPLHTANEELRICSAPTDAPRDSANVGTAAAEQQPLSVSGTDMSIDPLAALKTATFEGPESTTDKEALSPPPQLQRYSSPKAQTDSELLLAADAEGGEQDGPAQRCNDPVTGTSTNTHPSSEATTFSRVHEIAAPQTSTEPQALRDPPAIKGGTRTAEIRLKSDGQTYCAPETPNLSDPTAGELPGAVPQETPYTPSSPLSSVGTELDDTSLEYTLSQVNTNSSPIGWETSEGGPLSDAKLDESSIEHDYVGPEGREFLRLRPTLPQWKDFPSVLEYARRMGAAKDGCFKVIIPDDCHGQIPEKSEQMVKAHAYKIRQVKRNGFWQVTTIPSEGTFSSSDPGPECLEPVDESLQRLKKMFNKNKDKQIRKVRYRVDVPAWTMSQRREAGVPDHSPIHPLKGDKLNQTKAIVPGIHTPYVYESGPHFGATFQIHAEDFRLCSLNHLYKGRKIWVVVPSTAIEAAEGAFGRKQKCSQFMRHRAEFFFPEKFDKMGIPFRIVDQRPGETIVILPDAYHEGFSTGYTLAEAKNYAETDWGIDAYQPCEKSCDLLTAIPAAYMTLLEEGEPRLDLCALYDDGSLHPPKRGPEGDTAEEQGMKRAKV